MGSSAALGAVLAFFATPLLADGPNAKECSFTVSSMSDITAAYALMRVHSRDRPFPRPLRISPQADDGLDALKASGEGLARINDRIFYPRNAMERTLFSQWFERFGGGGTNLAGEGTHVSVVLHLPTGQFYAMPSQGATYADGAPVPNTQARHGGHFNMVEDMALWMMADHPGRYESRSEIENACVAFGLTIPPDATAPLRISFTSRGVNGVNWGRDTNRDLQGITPALLTSPFRRYLSPRLTPELAAEYTTPGLRENLRDYMGALLGRPVVTGAPLYR